MLQESKSIVFEALTCWPMRMPTLSASRLPRGRLHVPWQMSLPDDAGFWFIICFLNHVFIMFFICFYHVFESLSCFYQPRLDFIHVYSDLFKSQFVLDAIHIGFQRFSCDTFFYLLSTIKQSHTNLKIV
jgi:hypothetical protein